MTLIIGLIIGAIILLAAEIFLPGMVAGILGILCLIGSVIATSFNYGIGNGFVLLVIELAGCLILFLCWMKFFPNSPFGKRFSLDKPITQTSAPEENKDLLGKIGITVTPLRPSGTVKIDGQRIDVVSEGQALPLNTNIKVVKVEGSRIVVRQLNL